MAEIGRLVKARFIIWQCVSTMENLALGLGLLRNALRKILGPNQVGLGYTICQTSQVLDSASLV